VDRAHPFALILDDLSPGTDPGDLLAGVARLRELGPSPATVIVTTRADSPAWIARLSPDVVIGLDSLALSPEQVMEAMRLHCGADLAQEHLDRVLEASRGHAATVAVLARQIVVGSFGEGTPNMDLSAHLTALAQSQLGASALETLCAGSMLSSASLLALEGVVGRSARDDLLKIASRIPLVQYPLPEAPSQFRIHGIAATVYGHSDFVCAMGLDHREMLNRTIRVLAEQGDYVRLFELVESASDSALAREALLRHGFHLLAVGGVGLLVSVLEMVPARQTLLSPRLLMLQVELLREKMLFEEAMNRALVARDLAEIEEDGAASSEAHMLLARLQMDRGLMSDAAINLERVVQNHGSKPELALTASAYLALCHALLGNHALCLVHTKATNDLLADCRHDGATCVRVVTSAATKSALVDGCWSEALVRLQGMGDTCGAPIALSIQTEGNIGTALVETGRIERGAAVLDSAIACSERYGLRMLELSFRDSLALVRAACGEYASAVALMQEAICGCVELGDKMELSRQYAYLSMIHRAAGEYDASLQCAERGMEEAASLQCPWLRWMSALELSACLLAMGAPDAAGRQAERVRCESVAASAYRYVLTADLILAACDVDRGDSAQAAERMVEHESLIRDGSSNYLVMMYARAFPALLPVLAVLPEGIPACVLKYTPASVIRAALGACVHPTMDQAHRLLQAVLAEHADDPRVPVCHVRLFGGLEVRVGDRSVRERDWKKRKARLLFALMVLERGRDLSREQVCDQLWPDLDADRAKNNFYVIWSIMKGAVLPGGTKGAPLPYADNTGGLCRIDVERVDSDVEQFSRAISSARGAENTGDLAAAVGHYRSVMDIYRGELLPGDIYDDCFALARDRYRLEFCDAMRRAVSCAERIGDPAEALDFARRGLDTDPLSEDLYQAVMRSHIHAGQRSAAIEMYFVCRQRLCDDLGLDPSSETMKLYEHILAMDESAETDSTF
ncbi:MAG: BTAD domain-containing putative transcriptional regulator, partial [Actinomycetota bacterium]|nr:BTAD domain-containing putative transcriptional regulator [Actinomycetota bacterium]